MDDRRFDNAVRSLARHRSRRGLLGSLLGGGAALLASHLRLPGAAAQSAYVPQGGWCIDADQCDPWLDCAWNGYGSAGAACCAYVGGGCEDDFGCCGSATCFGGTCADFASAPVHGEPCDPGGNPCVYASGGFSCGYVSETDDLRCCADPGGRCGGYGECCGDNFCGDDGLCRPMAGGSGVGTSEPSGAPAVGERCQTTDQCRRPQTGAICEYTVSTGDNRCCWYEGQCTSGAQCCGSRVCADGVCQFLGGGSSMGGGGASGVWCGNTYCAPGSWCCNASCGICVPGQGACPDDECHACPGCDSGLCLPNGYCFS
jgi:hypothetical protein